MLRCTQCDRTNIMADKRCMCYTWFVRTCVVCFITCIIGLTCCFYCTYVIASIPDKCSGQQEIRTPEESGSNDILQQNREDAILRVIRSLSDTERTASSTPKPETKLTRHGSEKPRKKKKAKREKVKDKKRKKGKKTIAGHYVLKKGLPFSESRCPYKQGGEQTRDLIKTLDVFEPAYFVEDKSNPFLLENGKFIAKYTGLHLVYAQVLFEDCREGAPMQVLQRRKVGEEYVTIQQHFCWVGVPQTGTSYNNTCALNALFYLEKGDILTIENYYADVHMNFNSPSAFFGAVLLK